MSGIAFVPIRIPSPQGWLAGLHAHAAPGRPTLLLVPPFPHEWQRGYRLFALLAQALAGHGIGSLRFDPTGCGDSSGNDDAYCLQQLDEDSCLALDWLRPQSAGPVTLLGVRAGALVASAIAQQKGLSWIGWQQVTSGSDYLATLDAREAQELRNPRRFGACLPAAAADPACLLGHRLHPALRQQLRDARVQHPAQFDLESDLPAALSGWVDEIDLARPFPVPQVRGVAESLARQLSAPA